MLGLVRLKVWIDALTPKQLIFFNVVKKKLEDVGSQVLLTTRRYHDCDYVRERLRIDAKVVGKHGGGTREGKLMASVERAMLLTEFAIKERPEACLSFSSPEAARIAAGLGIQHYCVNDSPHSVWVARLTLPLSSLLFTPWVIPQTAWRALGIDRKRIVTYRALDPAAWLKQRGLWPEKNAFEKMGEGSVIIRPGESQASYMRGEGISAFRIAKLLSERFRDRRIIILPRYEEQEREAEGIDSPNIHVGKEPFFGPNLMEGAALLVGGGGTMNAEAALLGVPVISFYEGPITYVERYLVRKGLVKKVRSERECVKEAVRILEEERQSRGKEELDTMEDPASFIASRITPGKVQLY